MAVMLAMMKRKPGRTVLFENGHSTSGVAVSKAADRAAESIGA
jgi:hypothetical protein